MHKNSATLIVALLIFVALASGLGWLTYRVTHLERLNRALIAAIEKHDVNTVQTLLDRGADANTAYNTSYGYPTALMVAASGGDPAIIKLLIDHGADVNAMSPARFTALMHVAMNNDKPGLAECMRLLLDHGADVNAKNIRGWTALMDAAQSGATDCVRLLLRRGADVHAKTVDGYTALKCAQAGGYSDTATLLKQAGEKD